jgi:hypothetical protein
MRSRPWSRSSARVEVLIMEVRRSAAIGKPMVDIGIGIIRGSEIELFSITSASCR